ncbi:GNAT family N-acetyltransferase [Brevirhabdus sp.]|uniref:GNAT family N-acetyltransferase n=1 Tax=Brevirhabdus sp. TaxID=2004514 RepID=UPI0040590C90
MAGSDADLRAAQALRHLAFRGGNSDRPGAALDRDDHDGAFSHVLVEDGATSTLVCCFRLLVLHGAADLARSYAGAVYDLRALRRFDAPMLEMGRFCLHPDWHDHDILRVAWAAATAIVDARGVRLLFGCASFAGTDPQAYASTFSLLSRHHLGPARWLPRRRAAETLPLRNAGGAGLAGADARRGKRDMPPLLRSYLGMGGWVGDHLVVDRDLGTMHVFTALQTDAVPQARARLLRGLLAAAR